MQRKMPNDVKTAETAAEAGDPDGTLSVIKYTTKLAIWLSIN